MFLRHFRGSLPDRFHLANTVAIFLKDKKLSPHVTISLKDGGLGAPLTEAGFKQAMFRP